VAETLSACYLSFLLLAELDMHQSSNTFSSRSVPRSLLADSRRRCFAFAVASVPKSAIQVLEKDKDLTEGGVVVTIAVAFGTILSKHHRQGTFYGFLPSFLLHPSIDNPTDRFRSSPCGRLRTRLTSNLHGYVYSMTRPILTSASATCQYSSPSRLYLLSRSGIFS
jgi:hypothetical protein